MISGGEGSRILGAASTGLDMLKDIVEAVDTLPFVKSVANVGVQVLEYIIVGDFDRIISSADRALQEMQITNDMLGNLALRAKDVIVAVAGSCDGLQSMNAQLESDLRQLTTCVLSTDHTGNHLVEADTSILGPWKAYSPLLRRR